MPVSAGSNGAVTERDAATGLIHPIHQPEGGFLVLADISGFTAFTTATELDHGAAVIGALLAEVMNALSPPLEIQELEGDAVFALGSDHVLPPGAPLLELLRGAYLAFRERQQDMQADSSCSCRACSSVRALSLKMVVHHGRFVRQSVGGRPRVAGPDVILAHRLLKNEVEGQAYILLTTAALERLAVDPVVAGAQPLTARYAHFGEVTCFVLGLESLSPGSRRDGKLPGASHTCTGLAPAARGRFDPPPSREDAHKAPGREGQEAFEPHRREASGGGAGLVELEMHAGARRLRESKARGEDELPRPAHTV